MTQTAIGPITAEWIAAYAVASGDDNPLHTRQSGPAIVHGALLAALSERYIRQQLPAARILSLRFRFLAPVLAGSSVTFKLGPHRIVEREGQTLTEQRVTATVAGNRPAMLIEAQYEII